ncbi:MAG: hypothetical protein AVDCRST_MAG14-2457 [uncultured Rubrobacteraceae bacterium]|uniref:PH domain-containing protein n=1 Tax=uncultured Rubrobacteraceae bacterium TaxID=349277 RepID=A0A6J4R0Y6_9ACTN|nr:MAG: hypothetical protein AVDCRST_MAG14-2457 [uncultured Rubrobacteraceae bacterium]
MDIAFNVLRRARTAAVVAVLTFVFSRREHVGKERNTWV